MNHIRIIKTVTSITETHLSKSPENRMDLQLSEIGYCLILLRKPKIFFMTIVMSIEIIMFNKIVNGILDFVFMVIIARRFAA